MTPPSPPVILPSRRKRQRKTVSHYSDDNPSTFTVKVKKGQSEKEPEEKLVPNQKTARDGRRKRATLAGDATSKRRKIGRPRNRPPSKKGTPLQASPSSTAEKETSTTTTTASILASSPPPPEPTILSHAWTVVPIVPPALSLVYQAHKKQPESHPVHGKGLGKAQTLPKPTWERLSSDDCLNSGSTIPPPPPPLHEDPITCMTQSSDKYVCCGHASGSVHVYDASQQRLGCIQSVPTSALRRHLASLEPVHQSTPHTTTSATATIQQSKKKWVNFMHSIHHVSLCPPYLVLSTAHEVECWNLGSRQPSLVWRHALSPCVIWQLHGNERGQGLVTWGSTVSDKKNTMTDEHDPLLSVFMPQASDTAGTDSKEPLVQTVSLDEENAAATKCIMAKYDQCRHNNGDDRLLVLMEFRHETQPQHQELRLMTENGTIQQPHWTSSCRAVIPSRSTTQGKGSLVGSGLSQTRNGLYTLLACSTKGGVRVYQTETLELLQVYGENLVLHGKGVQWQEGFLWFPETTGGNADGTELQVWRDDSSVERKDELQYRQALFTMSRNNDSSSDMLPPPGTLVVGVPQAGKEPKELQDTLHLWHWMDDGKLAAHTIPGPPMSGGILPGIMYVNGSLICVSYERGELWQLKPTIKSDFPGVMYPPGYHVIDDNVEYLEDEDEVDILIDQHMEGQDDLEPQVGFMAEVRADDLAEAMRRSLIEKPADTVVVEDDSEDEDLLININDDRANGDTAHLPCHPQLMLEDEMENNSPEAGGSDTALSPGSPQRSPSRSFIRSVLKSFPQLRDVNHMRTERESRPSLDQLVEMPPAPKPARGRQTKRVSLEATIKASVRPELRRLMILKEKWTDGKGCMLRETDRQADIVTEKQKRELCRLKAMELASSGSCEQRDKAAERKPTCGAPLKQTEPIDFTVVKDKNAFLVDSAAVSEDLSQKIASAHVSDAAAEALAGMFALHRSNSEDAASPRKRAALPTESPETRKEDGSEPDWAASGVHVPGTGVPETVAPKDTEVDSPTLEATTNENPVESTEKSEVTTDEEYVHCDACRGRMVLHSCGKREIPIDYDAIERAEEEKRRKQEEEKKRAQAERRRQADVRRREAKRLKKEEEERKRQLELERERLRLEEVERSRQAVEEKRLQEELDKERRRAEIWQRLKENEQRVETSTGSSLSVPQGWQRLGDSMAVQAGVVSSDSSGTYNNHHVGMKHGTSPSQQQAGLSIQQHEWMPSSTWTPEGAQADAQTEPQLEGQTILPTSPLTRTPGVLAESGSSERVHGFMSPHRKSDAVASLSVDAPNESVPEFQQESPIEPVAAPPDDMGISTAGVQGESPTTRKPLTLDNCTSAQLGTVEALTALANAFIQSPPQPEPRAVVDVNPTPNIEFPPAGPQHPPDTFPPTTNGHCVDQVHHGSSKNMVEENCDASMTEKARSGEN